MFEEICALGESIDILINNAGISHIGLLQDMSIEEWNQVLNTNLTSAFSCSKYAIPDMITRKQGKIINISSIWGCSGASCEVAYSASKGGLNLFTQALAKELAPSNIQVNAIACGVIDTRMNACFDAEERSELENEIPAGRFAAPSEVADFVQQLIDAPSYQTEMKSENFSTIAGCGKILRFCCYTIFRFKQSKIIFSKLYFLLS